MGGGPKLLEQMRATSVGHRRRDILAVLGYYGYQYDREARHGSLYSHPELLAHPSLDVRMGKARVLIPKGREMPSYVAEDVVASVTALLTLRDEATKRDD